MGVTRKGRREEGRGRVTLDPQTVLGRKEREVRKAGRSLLETVGRRLLMHQC